MRGDLCLESVTAMLRRSRRKIALILLAATALNVSAGTSEFEFKSPLDTTRIGAITTGLSFRFLLLRKSPS